MSYGKVESERIVGKGRSYKILALQATGYELPELQQYD